MRTQHRSVLFALTLAFPLALLPSCGPSSGRPGDKAPDGGIVSIDPNRDNDLDGYTPNQGDCNDNDPTVHPGAPELCDGRDHDCNGIVDDICDDDKDGYAIKAGNGLPGGDCNDNDSLESPGAIEVVGNMVDDDCDGMTDEVEAPCPTYAMSDARGFASAFELCDPWLVKATINGDADSRDRQVRNHYGVIRAKQGATFSVFSTGVVADEADSSYVLPQSGTEFTNEDANPLQMNNKNIQCGNNDPDPTTVNDMLMLTLTLKVPTNAKSFSFNFNFMSSEYPEFVGTQYNDKFLAILSSKAFNGNISFDKHAQPITVNAGFFDVCKSTSICNGSKTNVCTQPIAGIDKTGYEQDDGTGEPVGGGTGWLTTTSPVVPGEIATLKFVIFDEGDHQYDTAVIIDNFQWQLTPAAGPVTVQ